MTYCTQFTPVFSTIQVVLQWAPTPSCHALCNRGKVEVQLEKNKHWQLPLLRPQRQRSCLCFTSPFLFSIPFTITTTIILAAVVSRHRPTAPAIAITTTIVMPSVTKCVKHVPMSSPLLFLLTKRCLLNPLFPTAKCTEVIYSWRFKETSWRERERKNPPKNIAFLGQYRIAWRVFKQRSLGSYAAREIYHRLIFVPSPLHVSKVSSHQKCLVKNITSAATNLFFSAIFLDWAV